MLENEAMIVRLSIHQWSARRCDRAVTAETAARYKADPDAGRWNKTLIARDAVHGVTQVVSAARAFHYENTLPWDDGGGRILPSKNFLGYSKRMRGYREEFESAVREFVANYQAYRDDARRRLNGMFDQNDYPAVDEVGDKFSFSFDIDPVPIAEDFRVSIQSAEAKRIKKELEHRLQQRLVEATRDLYVRLNDVVAKVADKLSDKDAIFRDSLVENVVELVNLLPKLNVGNDLQLTDLTRVTKRKLCALEPDALRKDEAVRTRAAKDAKAILEKLSAYTG